MREKKQFVYFSIFEKYISSFVAVTHCIFLYCVKVCSSNSRNIFLCEEKYLSIVRKYISQLCGSVFLNCVEIYSSQLAAAGEEAAATNTTHFPPFLLHLFLPSSNNNVGFRGSKTADLYL